MLLAIPLVGCVSAPEKSVTGPDPDENAIRLYQNANRILLERSRHGVRARVDLTYPDGSHATGYDEYFSGAVNKLHEVRPDYEGILVGDGACIRNGGEPFVCDSTSFYLGLRGLAREAIVNAVVSTGPCGEETCHIVQIEQRANPGMGGLNGSAMREEPQYELRLVVGADGAPREFTEEKVRNSKLVEPRATFVFDYQAKVQDFDLPKAGDGT